MTPSGGGWESGVAGATLRAGRYDIERYEPGKQYLARRQPEAKTWSAAIRALQRQLMRVMFQTWKQCLKELGCVV